jgi:hypothetical protein
MLIENTITATGAGLSPVPARTRSRQARFRPGLVLGKLMLTGLLLVYLMAWIQDLQRLRHLEAEPTPPSKVITKYEAWNRIYPRPNH